MKNLLLFCCLILISCDPNSNQTTTVATPPKEDVKIETPKTVEITNQTEEEPEPAIKHFICYKANESELLLSISFGEDGKALNALYDGQEESMKLKFLDEKMETAGAYPVITERYQEIYKGKVNGIYALEHSGNWDYAEYTRGKDGKVFNFTIDHEETVGDGDGYRTTPCFFELGH